jgi:4-amino-4-deoxy-L-arabinose transferase-like glycosyltransferase
LTATTTPTSSAPPAASAWRSPERLALLLVAASIALHLALAGLVSLSPQEAYYWQVARHPDLSYFDHPPLAAWTIHLTTALFGQGERAVRLAAALHGGLFAFFFFLAGRRLFGSRAALWAMVAALATPLFALGQTVITPDAPLLAGWAAALYFTVRALDEERGAWLLAAGAAVGFATLGKYTGWLLAPQVFLALLLDARGRRLLLSPWPYLALLLALALFTPVLVWNSRHGWISFAYQIAWRSNTSSPFSPRRLGSFLGLQALAVTPVLWGALCCAAVAAARRWRDPGYLIAALFSLPMFAVCLAASPFMWVKGNWAVPAYPSAYLAAAALYLEAPRARRRLAAASLATAIAGSLYVHLAMALPALPFPAKEDVTSGWKELAARVQAERNKIPGPSFALGCTYKPASELAYYLPGRPEIYGQNAMQEAAQQYGFWFDDRGILGREGIVVLDGREWKNCLRRAEFCKPLEELQPLTVRRGERVVTTFRIWRCRFVSAMLAPGA